MKKKYASIFVLLVIAGCTQAQTQPRETITNRNQCLGLSTTDKTYLGSSQRVMSLKEAKEWMNTLVMENKRPALGVHVDSPIFQNSRCFWSVSFYESDTTKLQLWREYLVEIGGRQLFIRGPDGAWNRVN